MASPKVYPYVLALVGALVVTGAEAAQPPAVQSVEVVNTSLPVTIDGESNVFVTNDSIPVGVQGPVQVTGLSGGSVRTIGDDVRRAFHVKGPVKLFPLTTSEVVWCSFDTPEMQLPGSGRFAIEHVTVQANVRSGQRVHFRLDTTIDDDTGPPRFTTHWMAGQLVGVPGEGTEALWILSQPVTFFTDGYYCLFVNLDPLPPSDTGEGSASFSFSGHFFPG